MILRSIMSPEDVYSVMAFLLSLLIPDLDSLSSFQSGSASAAIGNHCVIWKSMIPIEKSNGHLCDGEINYCLRACKIKPSVQGQKYGFQRVVFIIQYKPVCLAMEQAMDCSLSLPGN